MALAWACLELVSADLCSCSRSSGPLTGTTELNSDTTVRRRLSEQCRCDGIVTVRGCGVGGHARFIRQASQVQAQHARAVPQAAQAVEKGSVPAARSLILVIKVRTARRRTDSSVKVERSILASSSVAAATNSRLNFPSRPVRGRWWISGRRPPGSTVIRTSAIWAASMRGASQSAASARPGRGEPMSIADAGPGPAHNFP